MTRRERAAVRVVVLETLLDVVSGAGKLVREDEQHASARQTLAPVVSVFRAVGEKLLERAKRETI